MTRESKNIFDTLTRAAPPKSPTSSQRDAGASGMIWDFCGSRAILVSNICPGNDFHGLCVKFGPSLEQYGAKTLFKALDIVSEHSGMAENLSMSFGQEKAVFYHFVNCGAYSTPTL